MKSLLILSGVLILILIFDQGVESIEKLGTNTGQCGEENVRIQLCPKDGIYKYIRIKTYNGKYWYATPSNTCWSSTKSTCVKTRCCGPKPSVGQNDVKEPGRRTTFRVHCMPKKKGQLQTVVLEVLEDKNNNPSGYYLCNVEARSDVFPKKLSAGLSDGGMQNCQWILHQWRGTRFGLEPSNIGKWTTFDDKEFGLIRHGHKYKQWGKVHQSGTPVRERQTPHMADTYTIEIVPNECLDVHDSEKIQAGSNDVTPADCESNSDKCFMNNEWNIRGGRPSGVPKCFYRKDSMCFQPNFSSRHPCGAGGKYTPKTCETAQDNCCYDYKRNQCYKAKSFT